MLLKPKECERCELWGTGSGFSNWDGDGSSGIAIMAEALGEHEEREGLPLRPYAPAGSILHRALHIARLERAGIACYNTIQCRPPRNWLVGAPWEFAAIRHCQVHRQRFIDQFKPRVIVALGNVAMQALTDFAGAGKEGISYGRGFVMKLMGYGHECCVIPAYHPSFVLQSGNRSMGVLVSDLSLARRTAISGFEEHHREYQTGIGLDDLIAFHNRVKDNVNRPLSYDIENPITQEIDEEDRDEDFTTEITSIQFSLFPYEGIFAPWTPEMIPWIKRIMAMGNEKIGFNNWDHDDPRLKARGVAIQGPVYDMMWAWHHAQPDLPRGLQFVASMNGMDFPWKHLSGREPEIYGCADVD
ncbi:MAG: uracil-DNA glycosylase family protein, partial [Terriglobia bacterium]